MPQQTAGISPQLYARTSGFLYLCIFLAASFAHFLSPATGALLFDAGTLRPCFIVELSLAPRLIVTGGDVRKGR
jgi:hypothetical protein